LFCSSVDNDLQFGFILALALKGRSLVGSDSVLNGFVADHVTSNPNLLNSSLATVKIQKQFGDFELVS
jgi:hypothetical protein